MDRIHQLEASSSSSPSSVNGSSSNSNEAEKSSGLSLEACLKLLKGERDEQRLAGLLLVTKLCNKDDHSSIQLVYNAVGPDFLVRLLKTGMGKGSSGNNQNRDVYLQLSVTVLAAFCRVPEIAASKDMVVKMPLILELMSTDSVESPVMEECYEFVFLVSSASEDGTKALYQSGGMSVIASQMPKLPSGSHMMELAIRLVQLILSKVPSQRVFDEHYLELAMTVTGLARQFAELHSEMKFEALRLLSSIMSSPYSVPVHGSLRSIASDVWATHMRVGIVAILHNRVGPAEKLHALVLAESVMSIIGEEWLIGPTNLPGVQDSFPADRCILLVLESARVEIAVLLNELAYLKYEGSKNLSNAETFLVKQRNLGIAFSLVEKIIKLVSRLGENEDANSSISESTFTKIISGLNETISVVLDYLQDAKEHGQNKGDDLLASVRIVGSYLAETPRACNEKVTELLGYMVSIEGEDESSPFYSVCFMLPMLCQITMRTDGCKSLAASRAYQAVIGCLVTLIDQSDGRYEDTGSVFLACDTILNLLLKREQIQFPLDDGSFIKLLKALPNWTENTSESSLIMMASCICTLILDSTSEEDLLHQAGFDSRSLTKLSQLIKKSLATCSLAMMSDDAKEDADLQEIITSGYSRWVHRFPHIREAVEC